ncbi:MAG: hypothetical protein AAF740_00275 [Bacteroidota bacterium]
MNRKDNPEDAWLLNAEVKTRIEKVDGQWQVSLVFIDTKDPRHFLIRKINSHRTQRLAEISARYMQKTAARDARGTQRVNKDDYNFNYN